MNASHHVLRICAGGLVAITLTGCGASNPNDDAATSTTSPAAPSTTQAPVVDLVAIIEGVPGYTYAPAPEVERSLGGQIEDGYEATVVRAISLKGKAQGTVLIFPKKDALSRDDLRDFLAGAENGGNKQGTATRTEIAGLPAVKTVRKDGGTTFSVVKGRYSVIVGALPQVSEAFTKQLLARLPA